MPIKYSIKVNMLFDVILLFEMIFKIKLVNSIFTYISVLIIWSFSLFIKDKIPRLHMCW